MPIIADEYNPRAVEVGRLLQTRVDLTRLPDNLFVVLGGDGFMLKTVSQAEHPQPTFVGFNCGRVGFLLNDLPERVEEIPALLYGPLQIQEFPRIEMEAATRGGDILRARAINDIYLERMTGQTAHLKVAINGSVIVSRLVADGLICSTALGSTAYSFSAGASACHPALKVMGVTPICPHAPSLRPLVVPLAATVEVEVLAAERRPVRAVADGYESLNIARILIRDAKSPVSLAFLPGHDFTQTLVRKLLD